jgi:hypothetical protein
MLRTRVAAVALAAGLLLALTACHPGAPAASRTPSSARPAGSSPAASSTPNATAAPVTGSPCTIDEIVPSWSAGGDGAAGRIQGTVSFLNQRGTAPCVLQGHPIVTFDNPEAQQPLGPASTSDPESAAGVAIAIAPGFPATANVRIAAAGALGCPTVDATALLVSMPGQPAQHVDLGGSVPACTDGRAQITTMPFVNG